AGSPEAKVVADQYPSRAESIDENLLDEIGRTQSGEPRIEAGDVNLGHAARRELLELSAQAGQARRRGLLGEELARVGLEGQHGGRQLEVLGGLGQALEHRLMAPMHAVEIADGQRPAMLAGAIGKPVVDLHARLTAPRTRKALKNLNFTVSTTVRSSAISLRDQ